MVTGAAWVTTYIRDGLPRCARNDGGRTRNDGMVRAFSYISLQFLTRQFNRLVQLGLQGFARRQQCEVVSYPDVALGQLQ